LKKAYHPIFNRFLYKVGLSDQFNVFNQLYMVEKSMHYPPGIEPNTIQDAVVLWLNNRQQGDSMQNLSSLSSSQASHTQCMLAGMCMLEFHKISCWMGRNATVISIQI
jgi:hypothetical protein